LIAGDETSKNNGRTNNENINEERLGQRGRRERFNL
jgi:hypothetical protein